MVVLEISFESYTAAIQSFKVATRRAPSLAKDRKVYDAAYSKGVLCEAPSIFWVTSCVKLRSEGFRGFRADVCFLVS